MAERINCWDFFSCAEKGCPVLIQKEPCCWLVSGTFCRKEIQGLFIEKMEMCLECAVFHQNIDPAHLRETLRLVSLQFRETTQALRDRNRELKETNADLADGLSRSFEMVRKLCLGDPTARVKIDSPNEMLVKLGGVLNQMGESVQEMVDQSHELAKGLGQHYDTLNQIAGGNLTVTANEDSANELIAKLGQLINKETRTLMKVIGEYRKAESDLQEKEERYRLLFEQSPVGVFHYDHQLRITDCNDRFVDILRSEPGATAEPGYEKLERSQCAAGYKKGPRRNAGLLRRTLFRHHQLGRHIDLHADRPAAGAGRGGSGEAWALWRKFPNGKRPRRNWRLKRNGWRLPCAPSGTE